MAHHDWSSRQLEATATVKARQIKETQTPNTCMHVVEGSYSNCIFQEGVLPLSGRRKGKGPGVGSKGLQNCHEPDAPAGQFRMLKRAK